MRPLLLIGWIGPALVALAVAPASAQVVRCEDASGKAVYRNAGDCPQGKKRGEVVRVDTPPPAVVPQAVRPGSYAQQAGAFVGAIMNIKQRSAEAAAAREVKDRQRYEALLKEDPAAAARELEAQRFAREERLRNRPVVTNCNAWAPGYATCITK